MRILLLFCTLFVFNHGRIVDKVCNFLTINGCFRVEDTTILTPKDMRSECEKHDLTLMSIKHDEFGNLRKILYFRYSKLTRVLLDAFINSKEDREKVESELMLSFGDEQYVGWVTYDYNTNLLYVIDDTVKLPLTCWSKLQPRLRCPPNFKLYRDRHTCFSYVTDSQTVANKYKNGDCKKICRSMNSNLGSFHSIKERELFIKVNQIGEKNFWIGTRFPHRLNEDKRKGGNVAVRQYAYNMDGSPWENFDGAFADREPNGWNQMNENCVEVRLHYGSPKHLYNDLNCDWTNAGCVCECAPDQTNVLY